MGATRLGKDRGSPGLNPASLLSVGVSGGGVGEAAPDLPGCCSDTTAS